MYSSRKHTLSFWAALLVCLLLSAVATQSLGYRANRVERMEVESQLADRVNAFKQAIWLRLYKLETLAMTLQLHNGKPAHFFEAARTLVRDGSVCGMLLAPDGIVTRVWPFEQREQYMGLNLLKDPTLQRLINAGKDISLSGPFPSLRIVPYSTATSWCIFRKRTCRTGSGGFWSSASILRISCARRGLTLMNCRAKPCSLCGMTAAPPCRPILWRDVRHCR